MADLKMAWASRAAAEFACRNWHYSRSLPPAARVFVGAWEDDNYIGAIVFGFGAGNATRGEQYGLKRKGEVAELCRVALDRHKTPVSRMVAIAVKLMKRENPGIRLLVSFADEMAQGHHGGIYQAGNWIYTGAFEGDDGWIINGRVVHNKTVHSRGWKQTKAWLEKHVDPNVQRNATRKHRYLMPLDAEIKERILHLAQPYPKRV